MTLFKRKKAVICFGLCLVLLVGGGIRSFATSNTVTPKDNTDAAEQTAASDTAGQTTASDASGQTTGTYSSESIWKKQNEITQIEDEKKALESGLSDLQKIKKELEQQKSNLKNYVTQLDSTLSEIEQNILVLKGQIADKEAEIEETQKELDEALLKEAQQKESMFARIRMMYEKGDSYMTEMLLKSSGFGDFLNRADYMESIMKYDQRMWEEFKENAQLIALCKEELEIEKVFLDQAKASIEQEQSNIEALIEQKNQDIVAYESDISNKDQAIREYEAEIAQQNAEIEALEAAIAEEKKAILANSGTVITYDGGVFKFPLASYTRVSDDYGMRMHPTLGVEQFHNGVDFAAPKGTAIYAAYDGKVVAATYSATMGNYVMIDHGDGLYTIYMHASALYVSKDDIVVRGETIAAVGTTGRSTGNHLHFGVRKDGAYVSPWNYISS